MTFTDVKKKNDLRRKMTGAHFSQKKKDPATNREYYSVLVHNAAVLKNLLKKFTCKKMYIESILDVNDENVVISSLRKMLMKCI